MTLGQIYDKLRYQPHKTISYYIEDNTITSYHNSKDNAIMMLMEMSKYGDDLSLNYDMWREEYKCEIKLK